MEAEASGAVVALHARAGSRSERAPGRQGSEKIPFSVGTLVANRFRVHELLAVGGTSCLYLAWDQYAASGGTGDAYVTIKVPRRVAGNECGPDLIFREVAVSRRVRDQRVVDIFDLHQHQGRFFLTQEFVRGESLRARLDRTGKRGLPRRAYMAIGQELVRAVSAIHRAGLIHSDIKPGNVLLTRDGELRLIDLGTVRPYRRIEGVGAASFQGYSPAYASPQTLRDENPRPSDDIYSLACVIYEQISGGHPFQGVDSRRAQAEGQKPRRPAGLGYFQWRVLRAALRFDSGRRPSRVDRFWRRFRRARYVAPSIASVVTVVVFTTVVVAATQASRLQGAELAIDFALNPTAAEVNGVD